MVQTVISLVRWCSGGVLIRTCDWSIRLNCAGHFRRGVIVLKCSWLVENMHITCKRAAYKEARFATIESHMSAGTSMQLVV